MSVWDRMTFIAQQHTVEMMWVLSAVVVVLLLIVLVMGLRISGLLRLLRSLARDVQGENLEALLQRLADELPKLQNRLSQVEQNQRRCVQKVGVVRFDAFEGVGGKQSFSLALLDADDNGAVVTSLFGRNESRCYAKPVIKGDSSFRLTDEEQQAIRKAINATQLPKP